MNDDTSLSMKFDSSRAVVSTAHALRLTMPKLPGKAVFFSGDTAIGCDFAKNDDHARELLGTFRKKHPTIQGISVQYVEARPPANELRGSTGRSKAYSPAKGKGDKGKSKDAEAKKAA